MTCSGTSQGRGKYQNLEMGGPLWNLSLLMRGVISSTAFLLRIIGQSETWLSLKTSTIITWGFSHPQRSKACTTPPVHILAPSTHYFSLHFSSQSRNRANWQSSTERRRLPLITLSGPVTHLHRLCVSSLNSELPQRSLAIAMHH